VISSYTDLLQGVNFSGTVVLGNSKYLAKNQLASGQRVWVNVIANFHVTSGLSLAKTALS